MMLRVLTIAVFAGVAAEAKAETQEHVQRDAVLCRTREPLERVVKLAVVQKDTVAGNAVFAQAFAIGQCTKAVEGEPVVRESRDSFGCCSTIRRPGDATRWFILNTYVDRPR
jgi:hypothetical protein